MVVWAWSDLPVAGSVLWMSEADQDTPPCPSCGEPMQPAQTAPDGPHFSPAWNCLNPDCPDNESDDLTPMSEDQSEAWLNRPGTEGGANGGA